ncbi:hypothetical protein WJX74_008331 [Apatococcus lobatus]|uniref:Uncharacterized protein n=1 Tax=Apatococcus lobatus TaxID=904363 RepID=A0AAW1QWA7_9CHLO
MSKTDLTCLKIYNGPSPARWSLQALIRPRAARAVEDRQGTAGQQQKGGRGKAGRQSSLPLQNQPWHLLYSHQDAVMCRAACTQLDLVISIATDGDWLIHTLRQDLCLHAHVINVRHPMSDKGIERLKPMVTPPDGRQPADRRMQLGKGFITLP